MDPRSQRSRQLLRDAMATTVKKLPFEHITVVLLTQRAGVNRSTFYQHYSTTDDLLIDLINTKLDETGLTDADPQDFGDLAKSPPEALLRLVDFIDASRHIYINCLNTSARNTVTTQCTEHLTRMMKRVLSLIHI